MPQSIFMQKEQVPSEEYLKTALGDCYLYWNAIILAAHKTGAVDKAE
jgi:hypothetical protein